MRLLRRDAGAAKGDAIMITVKHLLDAVEESDGQRVWIEPIGLCKDLRGWCCVNHVMCHLGPSMNVWTMLEAHPDAYEFFRARYHQQLASGPYRSALQALACAAKRENFTLLHQSEDPEHNSAAALHDFLSELEAYCQPE
jgi:uncharacterized protein YeaO (DUF488 family)